MYSSNRDVTPESFAEVLLRTGKLAEAKTEGQTPFPATEGKRRGDRTPKTPFRREGGGGSAYTLMRTHAPPATTVNKSLWRNQRGRTKSKHQAA